LVTAAIQLFALAMCLHADRTPFSPGANDNASGVGVILALARRLSAAPLAHTEVWLAFTGCEEAAAYGISSFLDAHAADLGDDAVYIILDEVGLGRPVYLTADGLILKRQTHPRALAFARQARAALPELQAEEEVGIAYTDAAVATKRGLIALTLVALPPPGSAEVMHWHQMSDTSDHVNPETLASAHAFVWQVLQEVDRI
jgi:Iap family predicted aminopeptidase